MQFFEQVQQAAAGTPYKVERTEDGFDVTLEQQRRGGAEKVGIFFAALALGGLVVGGLVVALRALTGAL